MPTTNSIMNLHLRYRLWIAEMNSDITILRIFDDYLVEMGTKKNSPGIIKEIDQYKKQFIGFRNEIDVLKHEMQLIKMKLASAVRGNNPFTDEEFSKAKQNLLQKRYSDFRKTFDKMKQAFMLFEE